MGMGMGMEGKCEMRVWLLEGGWEMKYGVLAIQVT